MISEVKKEFDRFIEETFKEKHEIKKFLLRHERKDSCISNLCAELGKAEKSIVFNVTKWRYAIREVAKMFCAQAIEHKTQQLLSSAEKLRRESEANKLNEAKEMAMDMFKEDKETVKEIAQI